MNHKHRKVLHALFAHPISANIDPRKVESVLGEMGATMENRHNGRVAVRLNGQFAEFHFDHHSLSKDQVIHLKKFIEASGIDPERDYPLR